MEPWNAKQINRYQAEYYPLCSGRSLFSRIAFINLDIFALYAFICAYVETIIAANSAGCL